MNRYGANLAWDAIINYEVAALVIGSDDNHYASNIANINNDPVFTSATETTIAASIQTSYLNDFDSKIRVVTTTGSVYTSVDEGATFQLQSSDTLTIQEGGDTPGFVHEETYIFPDVVGGTASEPEIDFLISQDNGVTKTSAGTFFSFPELDTDLVASLIKNGKINTNNSTFHGVGTALRVISSNNIIHALLFDVDTPQARLISTGLIISTDTQANGLDGVGSCLIGNFFCLLFGGGITSSGNLIVFDITDTSVLAGNVEVFNTQAANLLFTGVSLPGLFASILEVDSKKYIIKKGAKNNVDGVVRIDCTDASPTNWFVDVVSTLENSNLPSSYSLAPNSYFQTTNFFYFITRDLSDGVACARISKDSVIEGNTNYDWELFQASKFGFTGDATNDFVLTADDKKLFLLNGLTQATTEKFAKIDLSASTWVLLEENVSISSPSESITVKETQQNKFEMDISQTLIDRILDIGTVFSKSITIPEVSDIVLFSVNSETVPTESFDVVYDFTNNQIRLDNTGTTDDVSLFYNNDGVTSNNGANPFRIWYDPNPTGTNDRQIVSFGSSGFFTQLGTVDANLAYIVQNSRSRITGNVIFTNSGEILRYTIDVINIDGALVKINGAFKFI